MEDDKTAPTEEQIKASNEAEEAKWRGDFKDEDLVIPYKREDKSGESTNASSDDSSNDASQSGNNDDDESEDDQRDTDVEYSEPASAITVQDPGEFKPADYSFEVTLKDGKTVKITTPEEADRLSEDPDNFETPKQLLDFIKKSTQMQNKLDKDYEKWESQKKTFTQQLETETQRLETVDTYVNELNYLVDKGLMPKIDPKYTEADWSDPEVTKQPGVKEQMALLNYMLKENRARAAAGVKQITSIVDAYNAWQMDADHQKEETKRKEAEEAEKVANNARKIASARVVGSSPAQQGSYVPKGISVGNPNVFKQSASIWDD